MSIEREYGLHILVCDNCGERHETGFGSFLEALDAKKTSGWKGSFSGTGEWLDSCPECLKEE